MIRRFSIILISLACVSVNAQTIDNTATNITSNTEKDDIYTPTESFQQTIKAETATTDTITLPPFNRYGRMRLYPYPTGLCGYNMDLHEGLNINIGVSVFATFGKHAYKGSGFGQNISAMYATPLTNRLTFAVGGYYSNMYWNSLSYRDAGFNAVLGYRFDEHWEAYIYGQKSVKNNYVPIPLYDIGDMGDRIGAAVKYNINPSFSIQVSVSAIENRTPRFNDFVHDMLGH